MKQPPPPCSCPLAGWCSRHGLEKTEAFWKLCQTRDNYRKAWDESRLHGQKIGEKYAEREKRRKDLVEKVRERVARAKRLDAWVSSFRKAGERGLGDTMYRLLIACQRRHRDIRSALHERLTACACVIDKAVDKINQENPY